MKPKAKIEKKKADFEFDVDLVMAAVIRHRKEGGTQLMEYRVRWRSGRVPEEMIERGHVQPNSLWALQSAGFALLIVPVFYDETLIEATDFSCRCELCGERDDFGCDLPNPSLVDLESQRTTETICALCRAGCHLPPRESEVQREADPGQ